MLGIEGTGARPRGRGAARCAGLALCLKAEGESSWNRRRELLKRGAALAVAAPYVITARSQETLIVNTQGGEYQELVERVVIRPFEKKFGVKVIHDATGTASQDYAKIRAARGAPGFDVAGLLTPPEVILGVKEGLLEKLTEREVPNLKHLWDKTWQVIPAGSGAPHTLQYAALVYNKEKIERPRSWADYWEPQKRYGDKIKGHVINYNPANLLSVYALIHAAQLGGGGVDNMEPAWAAAARRRSPTSASWSPARPRRCRTSRTARSGSRLTGAARSGYYIDARPAVRHADSAGRRDRPVRRRAACRSAAKNKKLAYEFLNWRLDQEVQRAWALAYFTSPTRGDIADLPAEVRRHPDRRPRSRWPRPSSRTSDVIGARRKDWTLKWQEIMA